jgi:ferredoxin/flavodoxin
MYKATIFYFSGTGNTWWAADRIKKLLDAKNINAEAISIDSLMSADGPDSKKADWLIKSSDLIFFGWPVYGSDLPQPMKVFVDSLISLTTEKHIHTFCTQMEFSGDGAWSYHENFKAKNLIIDSCAHFKMPSNVSIFHCIMAPPKTDNIALKIMANCEIEIEKHIDSLLSGKARKTGKLSYLLGIIQRGPYRAIYKSFQSAVGVDESLCTKCGQCAKFCPSYNIKMDGFPAFSGRCSLCMRCYSYCPVAAITYKGKTHNKDKHGLPYRLRDKRFSPELLIKKK